MKRHKKKRPERKRVCKKRNYKTKAAAEKDIGQVVIPLNMSKGQSHKDKGLHVYECHHCNAWHIGHRK